MGYFNTITIDIDPEDILNQLPDDDIIDYVKDNRLITSKDIDDYDIDSCESISKQMNDDELVYLIQCHMSKGRSNVMPRTKQELKDYISELIDTWHKLP